MAAHSFARKMVSYTTYLAPQNNQLSELLVRQGSIYFKFVIFFLKVLQMPVFLPFSCRSLANPFVLWLVIYSGLFQARLHFTLANFIGENVIDVVKVLCHQHFA
jgi:hypothetical protein